MQDDQRRLEFLGRALWPNGFWCDHCGYRSDLPWLCNHTHRLKCSGWRALCPKCNCEFSLGDERIRILMSAGCGAIERVMTVCLVWRVSLWVILDRVRIERAGPARAAAIRELQDVLFEDEIAKVFKIKTVEVKQALTQKHRVEIWKVAVEARHKKRCRDVRRSEARKRWSCNRREASTGSEVADHESDREDTTPDR